MTARRDTRPPRRRAALCSLAAVTAAAGATLSFVHAAQADNAGTPQNLHIDAQEYAATTPVDPYRSDTAAIHTSVAAGHETARSFVHIDVAELIGGPTPTSVLLTLTPNSDTAGNANGSATVLEACPLSKPLEPFNAASPPAFDCTAPVHATHTSAGAWSFELIPMLPRWLNSANNGVAILEDDSSPAATWGVAFDKSKSTATAAIPAGPEPPPSIFVPPPLPTPIAPPAQAGALAAPLPPLPAITPPPAAATPAPSATPNTAAAGAAGTTAPPPAPPAALHVEPSSAWLWWLLGAVLLSAATALVLLVQRSMRDLHRLPSPKALLATLRNPDLRLSRAGTVLVVGAVVAVGFSNHLAVQGGGPTANAAATGGAPTNNGATAIGPATGATPTASSGAAASAQAAGSAAASAQAAAAAAASQAAQQPTGDIPGLTPTTIRIGFMTETNRQAGNGAIGAKNIGDYGDVPAQARALADGLNHSGGIAGRRVIPVMENFDTSNTDPNQEAALCTKFTQDDHVFAVVDIEYNPDYGACYAHAHTLVVTTQTNQGDTQLIDHLSPYVFAPVAPPNERQIQVHVDGLAQQGFFGKTDKVGIIVADDPMVRRDFNDVGMPHLSRAGVSNPDIYYINPYADTGTKARDLGTAVTHMHGNGDTEVVLFGDSGGGATLISMAAAKGQGWFPKWGLDTSSAPGALETITEISDEVKNAVVVGYNRSFDAESDRGGDPVPASPQEKQCVDIYKAAGITFATRLNSVVAYRYCDYAFLLKQASEGLGANLSIQTWAAQAMRLGTSYMSVNAYHATYNGQPFGTDGYRLLAYAANCSCFRYTSQTYIW